MNGKLSNGQEIIKKLLNGELMNGKKYQWLNKLNVENFEWHFLYSESHEKANNLFNKVFQPTQKAKPLPLC